MSKLEMEKDEFSFWPWSLIFFILFFRNIESLDISLQPRSCICPSEGYTCQVKLATALVWKTNSTTENDIKFNPSDGGYEYKDGFKVNATAVQGTEESKLLFNFTSTLLVTELKANGTNVTCEKIEGMMTNSDTITICLVANASSPTVHSVTCNSSSAVVSFLPPAYGAKCVDHYVVSAVNKDRNITMSCIATSDDLIHECSIPPNTNVTDYNFTVYSVTSGIDGALYNGSSATDCCLPFPENVSAVEEGCGLYQHITISWKNCHLVLHISTTISWSSGEDIHYENTSSEESHQLKLKYSVTGPLEFGVIFSTSTCTKTSVIEYNGKIVYILLLCFSHFHHS
jgi:hypothetical protein